MALDFPNTPGVGSTYSLGARTWTYDGTAWNLTSDKTGYTGSAGYAGSSGIDGYTGSQGDIGYVGSAAIGGATGYVGSVGNGSDTSFTVTHGLDTDNVMVSIRERSSGYFVYPDVKYVASNQVVVEFAEAPTGHQYNVYVLGFSE